MRPTRPTRPLSQAILAVTAVGLVACGRTPEANAPFADAQRAPGALQLQSSATLPTALNQRVQDGGGASWTPPIDPADQRLLVPARVIEVRDTVRAGEAVAFTVNTIGANGCWQADGGALAQHGDTALVAVFDRHSGAPVCTMIWTDRLAHHFSTVFPKAGIGVIRASGRRIKDNDRAYSASVTAERTVVVLP